LRYVWFRISWRRGTCSSADHKNSGAFVGRQGSVTCDWQTQTVARIRDAPPDRYYVLILTGGVTSAIAYPGDLRAATAYLQQYQRFVVQRWHRRPGRAAEYQRRHGSADGFRLLLGARRVSDVRTARPCSVAIPAGGGMPAAVAAMVPGFASPVDSSSWC
jgi:hypothetical protein